MMVKKSVKLFGAHQQRIFFEVVENSWSLQSIAPVLVYVLYILKNCNQGKRKVYALKIKMYGMV